MNKKKEIKRLEGKIEKYRKKFKALKAKLDKDEVKESRAVPKLREFVLQIESLQGRITGLKNNKLNSRFYQRIQPKKPMSKAELQHAFNN